MQLPSVTTGMSCVVEDSSVVLTGDETYQVIGTEVDIETVREVLQSFKGLNAYWDCIEKAKRSIAILEKGRMVIGSLMVVSDDLQSSYGYYWNPPYEFHAWVDLGDGSIFDAALPGVIEKGLNTCDAIGPYLIGNTPIVLAGRPMEWLSYKMEEVL